MVSTIVVSCAQQVSPSGGVKDTTPPKIKKSIPENFATNFRGTEVELKFDEFVQLKNINQQLVISPSLDFGADPKLSGKKVTLNIGEGLKPNTTYQINFGDGIVDWNEGNVLDSNLFIFSTGDYIDSLSISGDVAESFTNKPMEGVLVMLYEDDYDSIPYKEVPTYFNKTDKTGKFELNYLKPGTYKIVALKDINNNYKFDNEEELIGFTENIIIPQDSDKVKLEVFQEDPKRNQYVESAKWIDYGRVRIMLNEPAIDFKVNVLNQQFKKSWAIQEIFTNKDTIDLWLTNFEGIDSLTLQIIDSVPIDTAYIALTEKEKKEPLQISFNISGTGEIPPFRELKMNFSEPLLDPALEGISLIRVADSSKVGLTIKNINDSQRELTTAFDRKEGESYVLNVLPGQFTSIYGTKNDSLNKNISIMQSNKFTTLNVEIILDSLKQQAMNYVLQLLNDKQKVIEERVIGKSSVETFKNLSKGNYSMVLILDDNNNKKWDTGKYIEARQPEKAFIYREAIAIEPGWDMDLSWTLKD